MPENVRVAEVRGPKVLGMLLIFTKSGIILLDFIILLSCTPKTVLTVQK